MANPLEIPIIPISQTYTANTHIPRNLDKYVDEAIGGFREGYLGTEDIMKRGIVGRSGAEAERDKNLATSAGSKQDVLDAQGVPVTAPSQDYSTMSTDQLSELARKLGILQ
jgi:hypothetical protein